MTQTSQMIADAAAMGPLYAKRLLKDLPSDRCARFSSPGGQSVQANHPTFTIGHLCLYPQRVLEFLGKDPQAARPPESYDALFGLLN
ncbi:MAG: hypothetical protein AAGG44_15875 [Planctomycetota bacterium]